jgi:hypothetical protein
MMPFSTNDMANPKEGYARYCIALRGEREGKPPPAAAVESQSEAGATEKTHIYLRKYVSLSLPNHLES